MTLQSVLFLCDILSWQVLEEAEALEAAAAQEVAQEVVHEVVQEVVQEVEVSEVAADQEVEQEAEAEEAEASSSLNGAQTENSMVLDWLKMARRMSKSLLALLLEPLVCLDM